jgi:hypothetical protein
MIQPLLMLLVRLLFMPTGLQLLLLLFRLLLLLQL